jgi:hypothetical protein
VGVADKSLSNVQVFEEEKLFPAELIPVRHNEPLLKLSFTMGQINVTDHSHPRDDLVTTARRISLIQSLRPLVDQPIHPRIVKTALRTKHDHESHYETESSHRNGINARIPALTDKVGMALAFASTSKQAQWLGFFRRLLVPRLGRKGRCSMKRKMVLGAAVLFAAMVTTAYAAWTGSPNGFAVGQCTWFADGRCAESGWRLNFSQNSGRDARRWYDLVTNGQRVANPRNGAIMVLDSWSGNSAGHVAYVEAITNGGRWRVSHANWSGGTKSRVLQGVQTWEREFEFRVGGSTKVRPVGTTTWYPIRGFIVR